MSLSFPPLTDTEWWDRAWDIPGGQLSVPTPIGGRENGASISGELFCEEKRDILATYAIDNAQVQVWLHPSRPPPPSHAQPLILAH
jgi:hypothetical protein